MQSVEIEVKIRVADGASLETQLRQLGFHCETPRTFERNILFDTPTRTFRNKRQILRLRQYGDKWIVTHKQLTANDEPDAPHKRRMETESAVEDGEAISHIFAILGYQPAFIYEKWRTEWSDGTGHCVVDDTPIGLYAELEGPSEWIDATLERLHVDRADVTTLSYGRLFEVWQQETRSGAANMTFEEIPQTK